MSVAKFLFVTATRKTESQRNELPLSKCLSMMNLDGKSIETKIFFENEKGLSEIYNSVLDSTESSNYDFIVFVHDDLWINDVLVFDKIEESSKYSDIIGICGGKAWNAYGDGNTPIIWTHASRGKGMSGFMIHSADSKQDMVKHEMLYKGRSIFATNYGNSPSRVLTIDGCFICFNKNAIEKGVRFDREFKFHFYDMDVCFDAFVKNVKIGTSPILVTHESLGYSVAQKEFLESQKKFIEKWFKKS